jgi:ABC-type Fe3+-hydroxamate transport system substrate-binding protein
MVITIDRAKSVTIAVGPSAAGQTSTRPEQRLGILLVLLVLAMAMAGCASSTATSGQPPAACGSTIAAPASAYPVTIQNCGKTLTFDSAPKRVIIYYQPTLELMIALGWRAGDRQGRVRRPAG